MFDVQHFIWPKDNFISDLGVASVLFYFILTTPEVPEKITGIHVKEKPTVG